MRVCLSGGRRAEFQAGHCRVLHIGTHFQGAAGVCGSNQGPEPAWGKGWGALKPKRKTENWGPAETILYAEIPEITENGQREDAPGKPWRGELDRGSDRSPETISMLKCKSWSCKVSVRRAGTPASGKPCPPQGHHFPNSKTKALLPSSRSGPPFESRTPLECDGGSEFFPQKKHIK